jgi:hypothetical protein
VCENSLIIEEVVRNIIEWLLTNIANIEYLGALTKEVTFASKSDFLVNLTNNVSLKRRMGDKRPLGASLLGDKEVV